MSPNLLKAISYSALRHEGQKRKDGKTPYISHPFRVCMALSRLFDVKNENVLIAALMHDLIEDTLTDYDDIEREFGKEVAEWVGLLSKDKRLPKEKREAAYIRQMTEGPIEVQLIKLADIYDNILDSRSFRPPSFAKVLKQAQDYIDKLPKKQDPALQKAVKAVEGLIDLG